MNYLNWIIAIVIILLVIWFFTSTEKLAEYRKAGSALYGNPTNQETWYKNYATPLEKRLSRNFGRSWTNVNNRGDLSDNEWSSLIYGEIMNNDGMYNDDVLKNAALLQGKNKLDPATRNELCKRPCEFLDKQLVNDSALCRCNAI